MTFLFCSTCSVTMYRDSVALNTKDFVLNKVSVYLYIENFSY